VHASGRSAAVADRIGFGARVVVAKGADHTYGGAVDEQIRAAFDWLVEGDERRGEGPSAPDERAAGRR
jgi:hypothetical protein